MNRPARSASFEKIVIPAPGSKDQGGAGPRAPLEVDWRALRSLVDDIDAWRELAERALEPNVFLEPAFACAAASHLADAQVGALVVREGDRLVGLMPGRVEGLGQGRPVSTFVAWSHSFAPLSTPLVDRDAAQGVVAALVDSLPELPGAPRVALLPLIPEEGPVARLIAAHLGEKKRAPYRLDPHRRASLVPGQPDADEEVSSKRLKELRRLRRRLAQEGALTHETATDANAVDTALAGYLAVEASGWKGRSGTAATQNSATARFFASAVTALASEGKARVDRLKLNGRTIAATITLFSGNRGWFWKTTYDEAYARFSPGVQLALDLTGSLQVEGRLALVDSCAVADHPMIDHLWSGRLAIADWLVPLGGRPAMAATIAVEHARRAVMAPLRALRSAARR
ncbi:MAG TPA: GNAT family N-acetyltransferase [Xanthobacteraceae bacterium]|jgi:CelD/BcsL family acetyltransferase involved in cellulose biosynthesis